jgi:hypothetical protein
VGEQEDRDAESDRIGWWVVIAIVLGLLLTVLILALREDSVGVVGALDG